MPQPLEYLTGNGLIAYPFRDTNTRRDITATFTIPDDCFLDLLLVAKKANIAKAYLTDFEQDGVLVTLDFELLDVVNVSVGSFTISSAIGSFTERQFFSFSDSNVSIKIVPGKSFIDLITGAPFSYSFLASATTISSTAFVPYMPRVTEVKLYNIDQNTNLPTLLVGITADDIEFNAGTNIDIIDNDGAASLDVIAGSGTGLYDGCDDSPDTIKTINFVPSNNGRFFLYGDGCYTHQRNPNGLVLLNNCKPKCTSQQIINYGHYHNRIKDGLFTVGDYAGTVAAAIEDQMNDYNTTVVPNKRTPRFNSKFVQSSNGSDSYFSFAVGLYNPSDSPISVTLHVTGTGYTIMDNMTKVTLGDNSCYLPNNVDPTKIDLVSFVIPCISSAVLEFVALMSVGGSGTLTITANIDPTTQVHNLSAIASVC